METMFDIKVEATAEELSHNGKWQVIFKTQEGLDYCRMTKLREHFDQDAIVRYARNQCAAFRFRGAVIQFW